MNLSQMGIFPDVARKISANKEVENFVCSSAYFADLVDALNTFLQPVMNSNSVRKVQQHYVDGFSDVPYGCSGKPFLIFVSLVNDRAVQHTRIAYLPLFSNVNEVSIFFPDPIINPSCTKQMRTESYGFKNDFDHYEIPIVLSAFIKKPSHFLSLQKIEERINR